MAHLNQFSDSTQAFDMSSTEEFESLLTSATDLGIEHTAGVRYISRNVVVNHRRLHLLEWGERSRPTVLLLHGGHQSAHSWDLVSLSLASRFHVIAVDQRGHGDSEWSRDGDYSYTAMADDILTLLNVDDVHKPIVFGHSMGGMVALHILLRAPELPRACVIVDVGPELEPEGTAIIRGFVKSAVEFDDLEEFVRRVAEYDPYRSREHIERTVRYNMLQRVDGRFVSKCDTRMVAPKEPDARLTLDEFRSARVPVLLVRGEDSNVLARHAAERFQQALPRGLLVEVPRSGHNVHSQNTQGFLDAVTPFLEQFS